MKTTSAFPYTQAQITTPFGWDQGPSATEILKMSPEKQKLARSTWPRIHQGLDLGLKDEEILAPDFCWDDYAIVCPVDVKRVEFIACDTQGCTVLRLLGDGWEIRIKHVIFTELSEAVVNAITNETPVAAGTRIGRPGNIGLSFGNGASKGRHLHYSFIAWGADAEALFYEKIGTGWNHDTISDLAEIHGEAVKTQVKTRGIEWMGKDVLRKYWDPFLLRACYEANPQSLGM